VRGLQGALGGRGAAGPEGAGGGASRGGCCRGVAGAALPGGSSGTLRVEGPGSGLGGQRSAAAVCPPLSLVRVLALAGRAGRWGSSALSRLGGSWGDRVRETGRCGAAGRRRVQGGGHGGAAAVGSRGCFGVSIAVGQARWVVGQPPPFSFGKVWRDRVRGDRSVWRGGRFGATAASSLGARGDAAGDGRVCLGWDLPLAGRVGRWGSCAFPRSGRS